MFLDATSSSISKSLYLLSFLNTFVATLLSEGTLISIRRQVLFPLSLITKSGRFACIVLSVQDGAHINSRECLLNSACIFSSEDTDQLCRGDFCTHLASVLSSQTQCDQLLLVLCHKTYTLDQHHKG